MLDPEWPEADRLELATALRDLRRAAGLSGQALGARVYMSQTKISRIETGRIVPSVTDGEEVWESYVENKTPGAWRLWWVYGPGADTLTIVIVGPHP